MPYIPTEWQNGDIITAEKLNKIEDGINNINDLICYVDFSTEDYPIPPENESGIFIKESPDSDPYQGFNTAFINSNIFPSQNTAIFFLNIGEGLKCLSTYASYLDGTKVGMERFSIHTCFPLSSEEVENLSSGSVYLTNQIDVVYGEVKLDQASIDDVTFFPTTATFGVKE